jgi:putative sterol carrier protein
MAVKFMSDEWLKEVEARLNKHEGFQTAAKGQSAKLQNEVSGTPQGDLRYWMQLDNGTVSIGKGDLEGAEATLSQEYATAVAMSKGETTGQAAFMQGKLKVQGNLMKIMQLQGAFAQMGPALQDLEVEY